MKKILSKSPYLAMLIACLSFHAEIANAASGDSSNSKVATTSSETSVAKTDPSVAVTAPSPSAGASDKAVAGSAEAKNTDNPEEDSPEMALRREEARRRFERGIVLHKEGDFRLALLEFERASELMPTYKVLFNIAQVSADLGYHARAFLAYHHYLDQGGDEVKESRRGYIIDELKILKEKISMFRIQTIPKQLTIRVDNAPPESYDGYIVVDAGRHTLQMSKEGYDTLNEAILFAPGEERELSFKLKKSAEAKVIERESVRLVTKSEGLPAWLWTTWGASAAMLIGSGTAFAIGGIQEGEYNSIMDSPDADTDEAEQKAQQAHSAYIAGDILLAASLLTAGTALYFTLTHEPEESSVKLGVGPASIRLSGAF